MNKSMESNEQIDGYGTMIGRRVDDANDDGEGTMLERKSRVICRQMDGYAMRYTFT